jgi:hypothetical protein
MTGALYAFSGHGQRVRVIDPASPLVDRLGTVRQIYASGYARIRMDEPLPDGATPASPGATMEGARRDVKLYPQSCEGAA